MSVGVTANHIQQQREEVSQREGGWFAVGGDGILMCVLVLRDAGGGVANESAKLSARFGGRSNND